MSVLRTEGLDIDAGGKKLLRNLGWHVSRGELWCVLGRNGIGKTSLMHTIAGLRSADKGSVYIEEQEIMSMRAPELARRRGMLMQHRHDAFGHTVLDTVLVGRTPHRIGGAWDSQEDLAAASIALEAVGMAHMAAHNVQQLSGGERQRVALAALLAQAPDLMLLDEPTSHQDVAQQLAVMRLVKKLSKSHAVVMNCHDIQLATRFATHVLLLAPAQFWQGTVADVLRSDALEQAFGCRFQVIQDEAGPRFIAY